MTLQQLMNEYKTMDHVTIVKHMLAILIGLEGSKTVFCRNVDRFMDNVENDLYIMSYATIAISYLAANDILIARKIIAYRKDFGVLILNTARGENPNATPEDVMFVKKAFGFDGEEYLIPKERNKEFEPIIAELQCYIVRQ